MEVSTIIKTVGSIVAAVLATLATAGTFPAYSALFSAISTGLIGWLHIPQPGASK